MMNEPFKLNDAQMVLLQLFQHRQMSPGELEALRDTLVKHLSEKLDEEIERVMLERGIKVEVLATNTAEINEHRTSYVTKFRKDRK